MIAILVVHVVVAALAAVFGSRLRARVFWIAFAAPAATVIWAASIWNDATDGTPVVQDYAWVPELGLDLRFVVDEFA